MTKPWDLPPLWWRCYVGPHQRVYQHTGHLVGHLGCNGFSFWDRAKLLPCYDKLRFENALREMTVWEKRERGEYELTAQARKVLRIIIGPSPDDPEYASWWRSRLVSVRLQKDAGRPVQWAEVPPVPLPEEKPAEPEPKKPTRSRKKKAS